MLRMKCTVALRFYALVVVIIAVTPSRAQSTTAGRSCFVELRKDLEGVIDAVGESGVCGWHIIPDRRLDRIDFAFDDLSIVGLDTIYFYAGHHVVGRFTSSTAVPDQFTLSGSNEAIIVMAARSSSTRFRLRYNCVMSGYLEVFGYRFQPLTFMVFVMAFVTFVAACCCAPTYLVSYLRLKRQQDRVLQASQVLSHEQMAQRLQQQQESRFRAELAEAQVAVQLQALPTKQWQEPESQREHQDCCSLCLEEYDEASTLRVLPCSHYFHKDCIDRWFGSRRLLPRSCPICKRNPLSSIANLELADATRPEAADSPDALSASTTDGETRMEEGTLPQAGLRSDAAAAGPVSRTWAALSHDSNAGSMAPGRQSTASGSGGSPPADTIGMGSEVEPAGQQTLNSEAQDVVVQPPRSRATSLMSRLGQICASV